MTSPFEIFRQARTLYRISGGQYINGIWQEGGQAPQPFTASVQPITGEELISLPEERRYRESYKLFTDTRLYTVRDQNPDIVLVYGKKFEVYRVDIWQNNIINHYEVFISKIDEF